MPITRRALLISNPGEQGAQNYCKGVYADIRNYQRLMISAEGGAWDATEIKHLDRPSVAEVRVWIANFSAHDYVFVMFTGHGWFSSPDKDRVLELRKGESIASNELLKGTRKRTLVLDCCQKVHQESLRESRTQMLSAANAAPQQRLANRDTCKKLFLDAVGVAEPGLCACVAVRLGNYQETTTRPAATTIQT